VSAPRILGIDASLASTGLALPDGSALTVKTTSDQAPMDRLLCVHRALMSWVGGSQRGADLAVVEGYSYGAKGNAVYQIGEVGGVVRLTLHQLGVPMMVVPPAAVKKFATGNGNADKRLVRTAAELHLGYEGKSSDEADALWLREAGLYIYGGSSYRPPPRQVEALQALAWPVLA
jgi:Holliday junction resolvasome RuvABC endonuclease subunit